MTQPLAPKPPSKQELQQIIDEVGALRSVKERVLLEIADFNHTRQLAADDLVILNEEVGNVEDKIIELDAVFKARKEILDAQLFELQRQIKEAMNSLDEAQREDKAIRQSWADAQLKLDKREQAVRQKEAKLSDKGSRIEELKRYDSL